MRYSTFHSPSTAVFPAELVYSIYVISCPVLSIIVSQPFPPRDLVFKFVIAKIMLQRYKQFTNL